MYQNYLNAPFNPATSYVQQVDPSHAADDAAIATLFQEDQAVVMGLLPDDQFGAAANGFSDGVSEVKTRAIQAESLAQKLAASSSPEARQLASLHMGRAQKMRGALDQSRAARAQVLNKVVQAVPAPVHYQSPMPSPEGDYHGVGGQLFTVNAPPGVGRLERLPFNVTAIGLAGAGTVIGDSIVSVPAGTPPNQVTMATAQIPWAVVRLVGVEITRTINNPGGGAPDFFSLTTFNVGGGADLFLQQGGIDLDYFAAGLDRIPGLRDYPLVRSPNQAFITVAWQNSVTGNNTTAQDTIIGVDLLVDVLADDQFGAHIPGPYASTGALVRQPVGRR